MADKISWVGGLPVLQVQAPPCVEKLLANRLPRTTEHASNRSPEQSLGVYPSED